MEYSGKELPAPDRLPRRSRHTSPKILDFRWPASRIPKQDGEKFGKRRCCSKEILPSYLLRIVCLVIVQNLKAVGSRFAALETTLMDVETASHLRDISSARLPFFLARMGSWSLRDVGEVGRPLMEENTPRQLSFYVLQE